MLQTICMFILAGFLILWLCVNNIKALTYLAGRIKHQWQALVALLHRART